MLKNYIKVAFRNLVKGKIYSFINIFGLSVAIVICLTIGLFVYQELSFDRFHSKADRLYRMVTVLQGESTSQTAQNSALLAVELQNNFEEVESAIRVTRNPRAIRVGNQLFDQDIYSADAGFFEIFDFRLLSGNPATILSEPDDLILTHSAALRFFGSTDIVGEAVEIRNGQEYETFTVAGLAADPPPNSSLHFEVLIPSRFGSQLTWNTLSPATYVLLREGVDAQVLEARVNDILQAPNRDHLIQNIQDIHLDTVTADRFGLVTDPGFLYMLISVSVLILVIACINFTVITVGYTTRRAREVGVRKSMGATRSQLRLQFWGETFVTVLIALLLGLILMELSLPAFNHMVETPIRGLSSGPGLFVITFIILGVTGLLAGVYPALFLSRFQPTQVLKGSFKIAGKHSLTRLLTAFQFGLSIFLIVSTLFMYRQMEYMLGRDLGYDQEQVLLIDGPATPEGAQIVQRLRSILQNERDVVGISGSWNRLGASEGVGFSDFPVTSGGEEIQASTLGSDYNLMSLLNVELAEGRFLDEYSTERNEVLVNRTLVDQFGWEEPLGQHISRMFSFENAEVVGVVENFNFESLHSQVEPLVVHSMPYVSTVYIRMGGENIRETLEDVEEAWTVAAPDLPFVFRFLDEEIQRQYDYENRWVSVMTVSALVAILIAGMGLFGLATLASVTRKKEIGIRKVLGANVAELVNLLTIDYLKPVGIGFVIAAPVAWIAVNRWLEQFSFRIDPDWWVFAIAGLFCVVIALATVSYQSIKTALVNPVNSLGTE